MIRRSISQIFQTNSPHEQNTELQAGEELTRMIVGLSGRKPMLQPNPQPPNPMNQQPLQPHITSTPTPNSWISSYTSQFRNPSYRPRSQIEAMPPTASFVPRVILDPAKRHPVFFTERLKKAPNGVTAGLGTGVSKGYVWEGGVRREGGGSRL